MNNTMGEDLAVALSKFRKSTVCLLPAGFGPK